MSESLPVSESLAVVDPFDLPDWLGDDEVVWSATSGIRTGHRVDGSLTGSGTMLACDLLAVDEAFPSPVAPEGVRRHTHQAWRHGQVYLLGDVTHLVLATPGSGFSADRVLDVIARLAKALGAAPDRYAVSLRVGEDS